MNERIQELAYEAEDYADGIVDQGGEFHEAYTKKLAELIVQECVNVLHDNELWSRDVSHVLHEHFGAK
jgi:hypothetical protein